MRTGLFLLGLGILTMSVAAKPKITVTGGPHYPGRTEKQLALVLDGRHETYWAGDPAADKWELVFDLGELREIPAFSISYFSNRYRAREATVDISLDAATWQNLGSMSENNPSSISIGMKLRYLRVNLCEKLKDKQPAIRQVVFNSPEKLTKPLPTKEITYLSKADNTQQAARFLAPANPRTKVPLIVGLHTWSGNYRQNFMPQVEKWCVKKNWAYIHPNFRGPNWTPEATGSELVVEDIVSAVAYVRENVEIDERKIFLVGASGGGYNALLMAARAPELWAGVSAWVPISDLTAWHRQCTQRSLGYALHIEKSVGGKPGDSEAIDEQLRLRSPLTWLAKVGDKLPPLDINTGIHDGHKGSVPISHSLEAFNSVAAENDRIDSQNIRFMVARQQVPPALVDAQLADSSYGKNVPLFRRTSGTTRITVFDGGHQIVQPAVIAWLEQLEKSIGE